MKNKINIEDEGFKYFMDMVYGTGKGKPSPQIDDEIIRSLALYNQIRAALESTLKKCEGASEILTLMALLDIFLDMIGLSIRSEKEKFGKEFVALLEKGLKAHGIEAELDLSNTMSEYVHKRYIFVLENVLEHKDQLDDMQLSSIEIALANIRELQIK